MPRQARCARMVWRWPISGREEAIVTTQAPPPDEFAISTRRLGSHPLDSFVGNAIAVCFMPPARERCLKHCRSSMGV